MALNVTFSHLIVILVITSSHILPEFVSCKVQDTTKTIQAIDSNAIKSELGSCNIKKGPGGSRREYCYIRTVSYTHLTLPTKA